jgi:hypothetical protein
MSFRPLSEHEPFVVIRKPAGKIAVTIGTKQINADGQQALLQDIKLRIHDPHQNSCLVRNLCCAPNNTQNYEHRQDHHDEGQSPHTIDEHNRSARAQISRKDANRIPATIMRKLEDVCQTSNQRGHKKISRRALGSGANLAGV